MKAQLLKYIMSVGIVFFISAAQSQIYVDREAISGLNNGSSWKDAYTDLQTAMDNALSNDTIWVSEGIYYPTQIIDGANALDGRNKSFHHTGKNIAIYGGFSGIENSISDRDMIHHLTVFSGDFNNDDFITDTLNERSISNNSENAYHVFVFSGTEDATINGVVIAGGNANDSGEFFNYGGLLFSATRGGGIYYRNTSTPCNLTITNCIIDQNSTMHIGGGIFCDASDSSNVIITNSSISNNLSQTQGGGIYSISSLASIVKITNSIVSNNSSLMGGGVYSNAGPSSLILINNSEVSNNIAEVGAGIFSYSLSESSVAVNNSVIKGNLGTVAAGGILSGSELSSSVFVENSTISNNSAFEGGGVLSESYNPYSSSSIVISHSSISNNLANEGGGVLSINYDSLSTSSITVDSSVIWSDMSLGTNVSNNGAPSITSKGYNVFSDLPVGSLKSDSVNISIEELSLLPQTVIANHNKCFLPGTGEVSINGSQAYYASSPFKRNIFFGDNNGDMKIFEPQSFSDNKGSGKIYNYDSSAYLIVDRIGLEEFRNIKEVSVFPNPSGEAFTVHIENILDGQYVMELFDTRGRLLSELLINSNISDITLRHFEKGVYMIRISNGNRQNFYRLVKD